MCQRCARLAAPSAVTFTASPPFSGEVTHEAMIGKVVF
jgi:hypothetical protein